MRVAWIVPAAFACAALAGHALLAHPPAQALSGLAQPLAVVTSWGTYGTATFVVLAAALLAGAIAYLTALRDVLSRADARPRRTLRTIVTIAAVALACAWFFPLLFSSDVYAYAAYGAMPALGMNPYAHAALPVHDPLFAATIFQWGNPPPACVYGPLFVAIARVLVSAAAPLGLIAQLDGFRVLASLAFLACGPLLYAALRGRPENERLAAAAAIAINPVAIWSAAEGHNDAIMLAIALCGFIVVRKRHALWGTALVAFSAAVKAPGLAYAGAAALSLLTNRALAQRALAGAILGTAAVVLLMLPFVRGIGGAGGHHAFAPQVSLSALYEPLAIVVAGVLGLYGLRRVLFHEGDGWCWVALGIWSAIPNPYPWYALWFLPVAALAPKSRTSLAIVLLSLTTALRYLPDAAGNLAPETLALLALVAFAPLLVLVPIPIAVPSRDLL